MAAPPLVIVCHGDMPRRLCVTMLHVPVSLPWPVVPHSRLDERSREPSPLPMAAPLPVIVCQGDLPRRVRMTTLRRRSLVKTVVGLNNVGDSSPHHLPD